MTERFTLVFGGDIRRFRGNPHMTETPFGVPIRSGIGDAFAENDDLEQQNERLRRLLADHGIDVPEPA